MTRTELRERCGISQNHVSRLAMVAVSLVRDYEAAGFEEQEPGVRYERLDDVYDGMRLLLKKARQET